MSTPIQITANAKRYDTEPAEPAEPSIGYPGAPAETWFDIEFNWREIASTGKIDTDQVDFRVDGDKIVVSYCVVHE